MTTKPLLKINSEAGNSPKQYVFGEPLAARPTRDASLKRWKVSSIGVRPEHRPRNSEERQRQQNSVLRVGKLSPLPISRWRAYALNSVERVKPGRWLGTFGNGGPLFPIEPSVDETSRL